MEQVNHRTTPSNQTPQPSNMREVPEKLEEAKETQQPPNPIPVSYSRRSGSKRKRKMIVHNSKDFNKSLSSYEHTEDLHSDEDIIQGTRQPPEVVRDEQEKD